MSKLKVVNLFAPPGTGKTAVRSGVFWLMRSLQVSAEEVSEYAKYLVHSGQESLLRGSQDPILEAQHHKQEILQGKYDWAVTDSPLLLCAYYANGRQGRVFEEKVLERWNEFENFNFFLTREISKEQYEGTGRTQTFEQAQEMVGQMKDFLDGRGIKYTELEINGLETPWRVLEKLMPGFAKMPRFE